MLRKSTYWITKKLWRTNAERRPRCNQTRQPFTINGSTWTIDKLIKRKKLRFYQQLRTNELTNSIIVKQISYLAKIQPKCFIRDLLDKYIEAEIKYGITPVQLDKLIEEELEILNCAPLHSKTRAVEVECVRYLLNHRNIVNNEILNQYLITREGNVAH